MIDSQISQLSADYLAALRLHDEDGLETHLRAAGKLGVAAIALGLGTLELAKVHDAAMNVILSTPPSSAKEDATTTRAAIFFNEALTPIEKTHRSSLEAASELRGVNTDLEKRTEELAISRRSVKRVKGERKSSENALLTSAETAAELLVESRLLEEKLREMTHRRLSANEAERKQMSLQLQDEIAQTLLGIHVKLIALKKAVGNSHADLAEQISATQRLMAQSVKAISSFANSLGNHHES